MSDFILQPRCQQKVGEDGLRGQQKQAGLILFTAAQLGPQKLGEPSEHVVASSCPGGRRHQQDGFSEKTMKVMQNCSGGWRCTG